MRFASCHPDRPYHAKNLCQKCYRYEGHKRRYSDPVVRAKAISKSRNWALSNPNRARDLDRKKNLWKKYNITLEDYNLMLKKQNGVCAICNKPETVVLKAKNISYLAVDHDHVTGVIRGLLCFKCNTALGFYEKNMCLIETIKTYISRGKI